MARAHRSFGRSSGSRRLTQWIGPADQGYVAIASAAKVIVASSEILETVTFVRARGRISIRPESEAADVELTGAVGVGLVSSDAFTIGTTAVPGPFRDGDWGGWFVWRSFAYDIRFSDATGVGFIDWGFEVDSKAMRKATPNTHLVVVCESQGGAFRINAPLRFLVKLS